MALNQLSVIGNLGQAPEMRFTPDGKQVTTFSVAVETGKNQPPMWIRVVAWDKLAELTNTYLAKGKQAFCQGRLRVRDFERKDGSKGVSVELIADKVVFLGSKPVEASTDSDAGSIPVVDEPLVTSPAAVQS